MAKNNALKDKSKVIIIIGPTASGKSDLAIKLAKKLKTEIISADSRQVYRGMDIGTGKVTKKDQKAVKHHLLDVADPKKQFTASDFKIFGDKALKKIFEKGKIPIITGGTGFYIDILLDRMAISPVPPNKRIRAELEKQSAEQLFNRLLRIDPKRSANIDRHNKRRLIRALEIIITTGKPVPSLDTKHQILNKKLELLWLGINPGKDILLKNIESRLEKRLKQGMIQEVKKLYGRGVSWKQLNNFGLEYRWISRYLRNFIPYNGMRNNLLKDIVKYSKRQMTWFKRNKDINWLPVKIRERNKTAERLVLRWLRD